MRRHLLVDSWELVRALDTDTALADAVGRTVDGFWLRDVPGSPEDGDAATGIDPAVGAAVLSRAVPDVAEVGVGVFGAGYWSRPTLLRTVRSLVELTRAHVNVGLGAGDKADVLAACGTPHEERHRVLVDAWDDVRAFADSARARAGAPRYWVASTRSELWRRLPGLGGVLLPTMSSSALAGLLAAGPGATDVRVAMLLRVAPARGAAHRLTADSGSRGTVLRATPGMVHRLATELAGSGLTDVILAVEDASPSQTVELLDGISSASGEE